MSRESWNQTEWRYNPITGENGWVELEQPPVTGNVQVEFAWGNVPMQPDDDRESTTVTTAGDEDYGWSPVTQVESATLNLTLDNHITTASHWNGYPDYNPNDTDEFPGTWLVPDVTGLDSMSAGYTLAYAGFGVSFSYIDNAGGATAENNGTVASQVPAAGKTINYQDNVTVYVYNYVAPEVQVFAWNLSDWRYYAMDSTSYYNPDFTLGDIGLNQAMRTASPQPAGNGWGNLYLRCTNVVFWREEGGITYNESLLDGDYLISYSSAWSPDGLGVYFTVDFDGNWPGDSGYVYYFHYGNMAIIQKN